MPVTTFDLSGLGQTEVQLSGVADTATILNATSVLLSEILEPAAKQIAELFGKSSGGREAEKISFKLHKEYGFVLCITLTITMGDGQKFIGKQNLSVVDINKKRAALLDNYLSHFYQACIYCFLHEKS